MLVIKQLKNDGERLTYRVKAFKNMRDATHLVADFMQDCNQPIKNAICLELGWEAVTLDWGALDGAPEPELFVKPIHLQGGDWDGRVVMSRVFGSGVKNKRTVGTPPGWDALFVDQRNRKVDVHVLGKAPKAAAIFGGPHMNAEQGIYTGFPFSGAIYGLARVSGLSMKTVAIGERIVLKNGQTVVIGDGQGIAMRSMLEGIYETGTKAPRIWEFHHAHISFQMLQMLGIDVPVTNAMWDEWHECIDNGLAKANDPVLMRMHVVSETAQRAKFVMLNRALMSHPFFTSYVERNWAEFAFRVVTCPQFEGAMTRMICVSPLDRAVLLGGDEKEVVGRYPEQNPKCILALDNVVTSGPVADWIGTLKVVQWRLQNEQIFIKGTVLEIDDNLWPDDLKQFHVVVAKDDIKAHARGLSKMRVEKGWRFDDIFVGITQRIGEGKVIALTQEQLSMLKADVDGDLAQVVSGVRYPLLWERVKALNNIPWTASKIEKSQSPVIQGVIDLRPVAQSFAMRPIVGTGTNVQGALLAIPVSMREQFVKDAGYGSWMELMAKVDNIIQQGTDVFKTLRVDVDAIFATAGKLNKLIQKAKIDAPWTRWRREQRFDGMSIPGVDEIPELAAGPVATMLRYCLPKLTMPDFATQADTLSTFAGWVPEPSDDLKAIVAKFYSEVFVVYGRRVNLQDGDDVLSFMASMQSRFIDYITELGLAIDDSVANAVWWFAHMTERSATINHGALPWFVLPDEQLERIVAPENVQRVAKMNSGNKVRVVGTHYTCLQGLPEGVDLSAHLVQVALPAKKGILRRLVLVADQPVPGQVNPSDSHFPNGTIGTIDLNSAVTVKPNTPLSVRFTLTKWKGTVEAVLIQ